MMVRVYAIIIAISIVIGWTFKVEASERVFPVDLPFDKKNVSVVRDKERSVTCWIYRDGYKGGISCIPDWQLKDPASGSEAKP